MGGGDAWVLGCIQPAAEVPPLLPPQMLRLLCICQTGSLGRPEAREEDRWSCPPPARAGVSTPGWRWAEGPHTGSGFLFPGTCTAISRHILSTPVHFQTRAEADFPNFH